MELDGVQSDFMHTNAVSYNAVLDQIVVSVPRFNEIWVIDHSTTTAEAAAHAGGPVGARRRPALPMGESSGLWAG